MRRNDAEIFALLRSGVRGMKISSAEYPGRPIAVGKELSRSGLQVCDGEDIRRPGLQNQRLCGSHPQAGAAESASMRKPSTGRSIHYRMRSINVDGNSRIRI